MCAYTNILYTHICVYIYIYMWSCTCIYTRKLILYIYIYIYIGISGYTLIYTFYNMTFNMCITSYSSQSGYIVIPVDTPCNNCMCIDMHWSISGDVDVCYDILWNIQLDYSGIHIDIVLIYRDTYPEPFYYTLKCNGIYLWIRICISLSLNKYVYTYIHTCIATPF